MKALYTGSLPRLPTHAYETVNRVVGMALILCKISSKTAMTKEFFLWYAHTANQVDTTVINEKKIDSENVYFLFLFFQQQRWFTTNKITYISMTIKFVVVRDGMFKIITFEACNEVYANMRNMLIPVEFIVKHHSQIA